MIYIIFTNGGPPGASKQSNVKMRHCAIKISDWVSMSVLVCEDAKLTTEELRFWVKCRNDPVKGLLLKTQLVNQQALTLLQQLNRHMDVNNVYVRLFVIFLVLKNTSIKEGWVSGWYRPKTVFTYYRWRQKSKPFGVTFTIKTFCTMSNKQWYEISLLNHNLNYTVDRPLKYRLFKQ